MGIPRLCKKCKYGALFKGDTEYKANAFCCHPSEIKNGYGKPIVDKVKKCEKFVKK